MGKFFPALRTCAGCYAQFFALLPLVWTLMPASQSPAAFGLWALNSFFTFFVLVLFSAVPRQQRWVRWASRVLLLLLNTLALLAAASLALTGALPDNAVLVGAESTNLHEAAMVVLAARGVCGGLALLWLFQLPGVFLATPWFPSCIFTGCGTWLAGRGRRWVTGFGWLPLALPLVVPALQAQYPFALISIAHKAYVLRGGDMKVDTSRLPAVTPGGERVNEALVLVLGESSSAAYWQINGYAQPTTPFMVARQSKGELVNFTKHMSASVATFLAVPNVLAPFGTLVQPGTKSWDPTIVSLMRAGHVHTGWISTQSPQPASTEARDLDFQSSNYSFSNRTLHDGPLVDKAGAWLTQNNQSSAFLVLHTLGSHLPFEARYPVEYKRWPVLDETYPKSQTVENYSNSILYTDHVLEQMIRRLEQEGRPAVMVYVSDHGESLMKGYNRGAVPVGPEVLQVPFMVWANTAWRSAHPDRWALLVAQARSNRVTSHLNIGPTLMHLVGLAYEGLPVARDLLSPEYRPWERVPAISSDLTTHTDLPLF